jgi:hypothetical protein
MGEPVGRTEFYAVVATSLLVMAGGCWKIGTYLLDQRTKTAELQAQLTGKLIEEATKTSNDHFDNLQAHLSALQTDQRSGLRGIDLLRADSAARSAEVGVWMASDKYRRRFSMGTDGGIGIWMFEFLTRGCDPDIIRVQQNDRDGHYGIVRPAKMEATDPEVKTLARKVASQTRDDFVAARQRVVTARAEVQGLAWLADSDRKTYETRLDKVGEDCDAAIKFLGELINHI